MQRRPELPGHLVELWRDYMFLTRSRRYEQGQPLPLDFVTLDRYAERFGPRELDAYARWLTLIGVIDSGFIEQARRSR